MHVMLESVCVALRRLPITHFIQMELPVWVGRIPKKIGYPAGGNLSADEWKTLALIFGPIAVRIRLQYWSAF